MLFILYVKTLGEVILSVGIEFVNMPMTHSLICLPKSQLCHHPEPMPASCGQVAEGEQDDNKIM